MQKTESYRLDVPVLFEVAEGVDPFYWINDDGVKTWRMDGIYSGIETEPAIWDHLAYNCIVNGVEDASRLDGWADLDAGQLTMHVLSDLGFERV